MWTTVACLFVAAAGFVLIAADRHVRKHGWDEDAWSSLLSFVGAIVGVALFAGQAYYNRSDVPDPNAWSVVVGERDPEELAAGVAVRVRNRPAEKIVISGGGVATVAP